MKDFLNFNIDGTNSDGPIINYHILSTVNPMTRSGISNLKFNLAHINMKDSDNDLSLANYQVKGWMEEIEGSNNRHDNIFLHIFQLYQSNPEPLFCK